jgi:hypothetical protein
MLSSDDIEPADAESSKQFQEESRADSRLRAAEKTERAIELEEKNNQRDQKRAAQAADADLDGKTQPAPGEFSPEGKALMIELGMWNEQYENYDSGDDASKADKPEAPEAPDKPETPGDGKPGFGTTTSMLTAGVAGTAAMLLDPAQALADEAIQQSGEAATRGIIGKTLARRIPFAEIAIPSDLSADPQENLAKAYNVSPSVFYQMTPEQMAPYQQALDDAIAKQKQEAIDRRKGRNRARVGKNFLEEQP